MRCNHSLVRRTPLERQTAAPRVLAMALLAVVAVPAMANDQQGAASNASNATTTQSAQPGGVQVALPRDYAGQLPGGAAWGAQVPARWNGVLLLFSRGYSPRAGQPDVAPPALRQALLDAGYALAASNYGAQGWALEQAVPAQRAVVGAFTAHFGRPTRTIAWGQSMGGLVTAALVEDAAPVVDGGLALCSSIGGGVGMMNMALDGAFAFRTLAAPDAGIELTSIADDRANSARAQAAVDGAMGSAPGRARLLLAGVLAGLPGWTRPDHPNPAPMDDAGQAAEMAATFVMGVLLPRQDQEARAGGVFSWNQGVDYRAQLVASGRYALVAAAYARAGLSLDADLARLAAAPRVQAQRAAVEYMLAHYTPNARPNVPLLAVQAVGDGMTSPSLQRAYGDGYAANVGARAANGPHARFRSLWTNSAGHCGTSVAAALAAIGHINQRLATGRWGDVPAPLITHQPPPMLRPCRRGARRSARNCA
ncbi:MAG: alpha/beta hydrolase [Sphingopyxis sp.]